MIDLRELARDWNEHPVAEPTPVESVYHRATRIRRRSRFGRIAVGAIAVGGAVGVGVTITALPSARDGIVIASNPTVPAAPEGSAIGWPKSFVSARTDRDGHVVVALSDARSGALVRTIAKLPDRAVTVTGTAISPNGTVWVTLNRGPTFRSGVNGGDPQPRTCESTVREVDVRTGAVRTQKLGSDDELVSDVQPSPTGDRIAYLYGGCSTSYFNSSIRVKDLETGHVVSIGAGLPRCHLISDVRWTPDGTGLVFAYANATAPTSVGPQGTCSETGAGVISVVSAQHSQAGVDGTTTRADPGCAIDAVAVTMGGFAGVEHCGAPEYIAGPARLVRYDTDLRPRSRTALGQCENGDSIGGTARSTDLIISTYQFCSGSFAPTTKVFRDSAGGLQPLVSLPGGYTAVDHIAF